MIERPAPPCLLHHVLEQPLELRGLAELTTADLVGDRLLSLRDRRDRLAQLRRLAAHQRRQRSDGVAGFPDCLGKPLHRARPGASEVQEDAVLEALRQRRLVEHARQDQPILMQRHQPLRVDPARSRRRLRPEQDKPAALTDRTLKLPAEQHPQADLRIVEPDLEALGLQHLLEPTGRGPIPRRMADERVHTTSHAAKRRIQLEIGRNDQLGDRSRAG